MVESSSSSRRTRHSCVLTKVASKLVFLVVILVSACGSVQRVGAPEESEALLLGSLVRTRQVDGIVEACIEDKRYPVPLCVRSVEDGVDIIAIPHEGAPEIDDSETLYILGVVEGNAEVQKVSREESVEFNGVTVFAAIDEGVAKADLDIVSEGSVIRAVVPLVAVGGGRGVTTTDVEAVDGG